MAKLIFLGEKFGGRVYELAVQRTTIGRADTNTLTIQDSSISEHHCEIYDNGDDVIVRDLGSRNGTVVNGELLQKAQRPLAHGQTVKFGAVEARLEITAHLSTETSTDVTALHFVARHPPALPPKQNPSVIMAAQGSRAGEEQTLPLLRQNFPASADPVPVPKHNTRTRWVWTAVLVALGVVLLWWLLR